ncbi:MAG: hypothetical protein ACU837_07640 [Gammaproteobacteria bacterium]
MIYEYIHEALNHAHYEIINRLEPFYGEIGANLPARILKQAGVDRETGLNMK